MHRTLSATLGLLLVTAVGCDDKPAAPVPPASGSPPAPAATIPSTAVTTAATAAPKAASAAFGAFNVVAEGSSITIFPMGDAAVADTGAFYALLTEGPLEQDPLLFRSSVDRGGGKIVMTEIEKLSEFFGAWPGEAWAKGADGQVKRTNDLWVKTDVLREGETLRDTVVLDQKRALAAIRMAAADIRFQLTGSSAGGVIPGPGKPTPEQEGCEVRMDPDAPIKLGSTSAGHMFAVGRECKTGKVIAERWKPSTVRGDVDVVEGVSGTPQAVAAAAPDEAYALFVDGANTFLATWDGKAWKAEKSPAGSGRQLFVSSDGGAWLVGDAGLFQHPKGGAWTKVDVGGAKVTSAWAKDAKTVWAVVDGKTLVRTGGAPAPVVKLADPGEVEAALTRDRRWLASSVCKRTLVMISAIPGDKAPTSYAPLTDAVKGNAELTAKEIEYVVEDIAGTLWASAKMPNRALAEKLVTAVKAKAPAAKPMIFCHEPLIVKGALKVDG